MSAADRPSDRLRLVREDEEHLLRWARRSSARDAIAAENRAAATNPTLDPRDPRWVLAMRTQSQLQGSVLTPERRERVMRTAKSLGVRTFDASVIIALVQDQARRGGDARSAATAISLVDAQTPEPTKPIWPLWVSALISAAAVATAMAAWVVAG